ncbi:MAG: winged helix-turn-helix transcriptional regulator [Acidobacteria bacterium]|nr:winged helix-turn-helix transcriptional regulator [Acidobacteriota bacterium]
MSATPLSARDLSRVAARFKALAEPARLRVLQCLQNGPQHVSQIMEATGLRQANLSKHLQTLHGHGLVSRTRAGRYVHYAIADPAVMAICDLMCRQMATAPVRRRERPQRRVAPVVPTGGFSRPRLAGPRT